MRAAGIGIQSSREGRKCLEIKDLPELKQVPGGGSPALPRALPHKGQLPTFPSSNGEEARG